MAQCGSGSRRRLGDARQDRDEAADAAQETSTGADASTVSEGIGDGLLKIAIGWVEQALLRGAPAEAAAELCAAQAIGDRSGLLLDSLADLADSYFEALVTGRASRANYDDLRNIASEHAELVLILMTQEARFIAEFDAEQAGPGSSDVGGRASLSRGSDYVVRQLEAGVNVLSRASMHRGSLGRTPVRQLIDALIGPLASGGDMDAVMGKASDDIASATYGFTRQRIALDTVRTMLVRTHAAVKAVLHDNDRSDRTNRAARLSAIAKDLCATLEVCGSRADSLIPQTQAKPKSATLS